MSNKTEKDIKWWLRHVIIPLLVGSGGLISLLIAFKPIKNSPRQITEIKSSQLSVKQGVVGNISAKNGSVYIINEGLETEKISKSKGLVSVAPEREIDGRSGFFQCNYGALAMLPNARTRLEAVNADTFLILSPGKKYKLKVLNSPIWLQFNHHLSDTNGKRRHLGVFIVTFGRMGATMPLEVYRNKNWVRPQNKKILGQFSEIVELPWPEFVASIRRWSSPDAKLSEVDRVVKGPWHAIPEGGDKFSWQYRDFWKWAVTNCQETAKGALGEVPDFSNVKVSTRLISYSPSPLPGSKSPVIFDIRSMYEDKTAAFIAIYALEDSGQDIREWYWITREN
jgi:hypothetical protein